MIVKSHVLHLFPVPQTGRSHILNILLASFFGPYCKLRILFFCLFVFFHRFMIYDPRASRLGHKLMEKNSVRNLQYWPKTQLMRGIYSAVTRSITLEKGQRKFCCIRGKILPTRNKNHGKSIRVPRPLSVKQTVKITFAQWQCRSTFQSMIYPADDKNFIIVTSNILAWGKLKVV